MLFCYIHNIMLQHSGLTYLCLCDTMIYIAANRFNVKTFHFRFESGKLIFQLDFVLVTFQQNVQRLNHRVNNVRF